MHKHSIVDCETLQYLYAVGSHAVYEIFQKTRPRAKFTNEFEHFVTASFFFMKSICSVQTDGACTSANRNDDRFSDEM